MERRSETIAAGRLSRGWRLTRVCLRILLQDKGLMAFPLLSAGLSGLVWLAFLLPILLTGDRSVLAPLAPLVFFGLYFCNYTVVVFCNAALLRCAHGRLVGQPCGFRGGVLHALSKLDRILAWAAMSGLVGVTVRGLEKGGSRWQTWLGRLFQGSWSVITYFAVPIMLLEDTSPWTAMSRSREVMGRTWGSALHAYYGFGAVANLLTSVCVVTLLLAYFVAATVEHMLILGATAAVVVPALAAGSLVLASLGQIFRAALYHYARTSTIPDGFEPEMVRDAFYSLP